MLIPRTLNDYLYSPLKLVGVTRKITFMRIDNCIIMKKFCSQVCYVAIINYWAKRLSNYRLNISCDPITIGQSRVTLDSILEQLLFSLASTPL